MKTSFKHYVPVLIISAVLILAIMFLPMFGVWGGTFNFDIDDADATFFDVISFVFGGEHWMSYRMWSVRLILASIIPAVALLIFSICKLKIMCIVSAGSGIAGVGYVLIDYCRDTIDGLDDLFGKYSSVSIGTWIVLALFVTALILAIMIKNKGVNKQSSITNSVQNT